MKASATLLALASAATLTLTPRPAPACGPPLASMHRQVQPAPGAEGVPTNAEVRVTYRGCVDALVEAGLAPSLETAAGAEVAATVERVEDAKALGRVTFVLRPEAPLAAGADHRVVDGIRVGGELASSCTDYQAQADDVTAFATFTTGAGADTAPPAFAGLDGASAEAEACLDVSCCEPYAIQRVTLAFTPATDDMLPGELRYNVYAQSQASPLARYVKDPVGIACDRHPDPPLGAFALPSESPAMLYVHAVDLAGNEAGASTPVAVAFDCNGDSAAEPGPEPAAEPGPEPAAEPGPEEPADTNAGAESEPDAVPAPNTRGSGCQGSGAGAMAPLLALLAMLMGLRSRRQRS